MKKILALLLALAMIMGLAACGGNQGGDNSDAATKVSVFWYEESDVYLSTVRAELNKELDALGVAYDNQFAANDQSKQIDQIKTAIAGGSNLLIVNVVTSGAPDTAEDIIAPVALMLILEISAYSYSPHASAIAFASVIS